MASGSDQISLQPILRSVSRFSHGQDRPVHKVSTLHSPHQLDRVSPVQEQDIPVNNEHIEDGNETQPSLSSFPAPSNPDSIREEKDTRFTSLRRATHWKTVGMIIGFFFAGQPIHSRGRMPLTVHSTSFRLGALSLVQKAGRQAYRHKLSYATPDLRNLYPIDYHFQSSTDSKCRNLLCAALMACSARECNATQHDRNIIHTSY